MSKELATIITDVPVDYDFANAKIDGKASLYTEEAYLLCKRLEFKNLLNRFTVDAPKNHAEESFQIVKDQKTADRIWKKPRKSGRLLCGGAGSTKPAAFPV